MKQFASLILLLLAAICGFIPFAAASNSLHFVTEPFPPFSYEEGGKAAGPMAEVIQAVCAEAKVSCTSEVMPWRRAIAEAEEGRVDGIFSILHGPDREKKFFLSDPIISSAYSFFALKRSAWTYNSVNDLSGLTIGVYGPSSTSRALDELIAATKDAKNIKVELELENFDAYKKLMVGMYGPKAVVVANRDVGLALLKGKNLAGIIPVGDVKQIAYCFGLSRQKSTAGQMEILNKALRKLAASGNIKVILARHGLQAAAKSK